MSCSFCLHFTKSARHVKGTTNRGRVGLAIVVETDTRVGRVVVDSRLEVAGTLQAVVDQVFERAAAVEAIVSLIANEDEDALQLIFI